MTAAATRETDHAKGDWELARNLMKSAARDIIETLILTAVIFFIVQSVVKNFKVEGSSMEPTLHNDEFLLVDKAVYWSVSPGLVHLLFPGAGQVADGERVFLFHGPQRGDIIVFRYPNDPSRDFIKRVIGVPGDLVEIRNHQVTVNGQPVNEPYIEAPPQYAMTSQRVMPGNYFVLGDNRNNSSDSHVWGQVAWYYIIGQAWVSYWPLGDWQFFPSAALANH
jgi:signal peptidase I